MICATRSASARATATPSPSTLDRGTGDARRPGRTRSATRRARSPQVDPLGVDLERVGVELREVEQVGGQLREPVDLLAHRAHELGPRRGVGLVLVEQLDEPAEREDRRAQLVRGVGDELLAGAVEPREPPLHLVEGAGELADLVVGLDPGSGARSRPRRPSPPPPRAGAAAARAHRPRSQPAASAADAARSPPAIRIWRRISATLSSTSASGVDSTATQRGLPRPSSGTAASPRALAGDLLDGRADAAAGRRGGGGRVVGQRSRSRSSSESATTNAGCGPVGPSGPRAASRARRSAGRRRARSAAARRSESPAPHRAAEPARSASAPDLLEPPQLLGGQARAKLRDDVEVDEPDRRRGDHEEQQREPVADAVQVQRYRSLSRKR